MKIGIDTLGCDHSQSGQGAYLLNFISNLPTQTNLTFELFGLEVDRYIYTSDKPLEYNSININDNIKAFRRWHKRPAKKFYKKNKYDVVIYPAVEKVLPKKFKTKGIAVVNCVVSVVYEKYTRGQRRRLRKGLSRVQTIIAGSEYIKQDLVNNGFDTDKIFVIHNGINHKLFFPEIGFDNDFVDIKPFAIKRPYFIYGSKLSDADKKHEQLIKAFSLFKKRTEYPHRLVICGSDGNYSDYIKEIAYNSEFASDILITGYFPHESFSKLYAAATACVFPAVNEGVGLPIIEAMASGIPVLSSSSGALKEIGGEVPLYFDSDNIDEIADLLQKIVEDEELYKRKVSEGLEWSKHYNWEDTVAQTLKLIEQ